jgi:membrane fusion protein, heavy metal efflux system
LVAGAAVIGGLLAVKMWSHTPPPDASAPAEHSFQPSEAQKRSLGIAAVVQGSFHSEIATEGVVAYNDETVTPVYSPYSGRVTKVMAHLGDRVKRGQTLYTIAGGEYAQGQSDVATTRAVVETARANERRQKELYDAGASAERDWQQAQSDRIAAEAAWSAARARLKILGHSDADIDALEKAPIGGPETAVSAPVDGTVTQRSVAVGQLIQSAANGAGAPVFVIADVKTVWVLGWVREADAAAVRPGQTAEVSIASLPGERYVGKVLSVASGLDPSNHRLAVRIALDNRSGRLKPEMYADVRIATSETVQRPAVPSSAVVYDGDVTRVFVDANGKIEGRNIKVGRRLGDALEVLEGVKVGEKIVTSSTLFVDHAVAGE